MCSVNAEAEAEDGASERSPHITHTQCMPQPERGRGRGRERERGSEKRRLSTSFCWICFIKNDKLEEGKRRRREKRTKKRREKEKGKEMGEEKGQERGEGQREKGQQAEQSWLWQAAYGSYFAPFRQLMRCSLAWQAVSLGGR